MIGFGMGGNVMGGPGNFGDPDDESARGAHVSGYGTTGLQTTRNIEPGIGQQVLGMTPNEIAAHIGLLDYDEEYEAQKYEPIRFNYGPFSFDTEEFIGPALDTYNTVVQPAVENVLNTPVAETAATAILSMPSTVGGAVVAALENLDDNNQTVQEFANSVVSPSTDSGAYMGGPNTELGHPDYGMNGYDTTQGHTGQFAPEPAEPSFLDQVKQKSQDALDVIGPAYNAVPSFFDALDNFMNNSSIEIGPVMDSNLPGVEGLMEAGGVLGGGSGVIGPDFDTGAVSEAGGEALQQALAQRVAESMIAEQAARAPSNNVTIPMSSGPDIVIDITPPVPQTSVAPQRRTAPRPSPVKIAAKSVAKPKAFKALPKFAQKEIRQGKVPTTGSDYIQDMVSAFLATPEPAWQPGSGTRPPGADR